MELQSRGVEPQAMERVELHATVEVEPQATEVENFDGINFHVQRQFAELL